MMNSVIPLFIGKEVAWFALATFLSYIMAICWYLLFESFGFQMYADEAALTVAGVTPIALLIGLFSQDIAFLLCAVQRLKNEGERLIEWKEAAARLSFPKKIGFGVLAALVILVVVGLQEMSLYLFFDANELMKSPWDGVENFGSIEKIFLFYFIVISGPIIEELYYREAMLGSSWRRGFPRFAVIFSSAFFGIIHFDFLHILAYLISGVGLSLLYVKTKSIAVPVIAHMTINLVAYFFLISK